jgi:hypothetical protein
LAAVIDQRNGAFDSALRTYSSEAFQLPGGSSANFKTDLAILATLNKLLIIRYPGHSQQRTISTLLLQLQPLCENHPNQYIRMAHRLVHAMSSPDASTDASIMRKKTLAQAAVNRAHDIHKTTQNREFVTMALSYFSAAFFADQVGPKTIQAVRATNQNSVHSRKPIWMAVAYGMRMSTYRRNGFVEEAQVAQREYEEMKHLLPLTLTGGTDEDAEGEEDADGDVELVG